MVLKAKQGVSYMTYTSKIGSGCSGQAEGVDLPTRGEASHTSYRYSILRLSILRHQIKRPRDLYFYPDTHYLAYM